MSIVLEPGNITIAKLREIWEKQYSVKIKKSFKQNVDKSSKIVKKLSKSNLAIYGVNTGFGKLDKIKISEKDTERLQKNLILSHCCGIGEPLDISTTRLMMILKILSLGRGASGVRWEIIELIENMLVHQITPIIPVQGSVGASGDLAPLAHMTAAMIGEGDVFFKNERMNSKNAFKKVNLLPVKLNAKEGLGLINGTQFSTACALDGLFSAFDNAATSIFSSALSTDAIMGSTAPFENEIHSLRGHQGQIAVAFHLRKILKGSKIRESHKHNDNRVQDPYCIRCQPQVTGAAIDLLRMASKTLEIEANAVTDNPIVILNKEKIVSGGNFHAEPVAFAADQIAIALAEIGSISQRRVALMVDPALSYDLPPFLTPNPGINSGMMIAEVTSAALMSENKHLANPCSTDSTPTSANQEDHVSMSAHGAIRLRKINRNLNIIIGIELLCAAQGVEFRSPLKTSPELKKTLITIRKNIKKLENDRYLSSDIDKASKLVRNREILNNSLIRNLLNHEGI